MNMIGIDCHIYDLNIQLYTSLPDNRLSYHTHVTHQHLAPILRRKYHVVSKQ